MSNLPAQENLGLGVTDFGPIVEGHIQLRPLTVFVGPSNTGKSYLAILIYALHRIFAGEETRGRWAFFRAYQEFERSAKKGATQELLDALMQVAEQMRVDTGKLNAKNNCELPSQISGVIRSTLNALGTDIATEIGRCFGVESIGSLIRKGRNRSASIQLERQYAKGQTLLKHQLTIKGGKAEFSAAIPEFLSIALDITDIGNFSYELDHLYRERTKSGSANKVEDESFWVARIIASLTELSVPTAFRPLHRPAFYLPADRTGVMHAHNVVVSALIERASMAGLRPTGRTPTLSGVLADFLEQLIELDSPTYSRRRRKGGLGRRIEQAILGGSVQVERSEVIGYPHFTYRPNRWRKGLSLMNASSMVSELAPVVLYLRHMVDPGNVLIIEEPESHLHPAMQVEFIRQLAFIVRSGIRVIVTTHSEWVLEELTNLVLASRISSSERKNISRNDYSLLPEQVGAWFFKPKQRPKGSVVSEIDLEQAGLYSSSFNEVATKIHNDWAEISSMIETSR